MINRKLITNMNQLKHFVNNNILINPNKTYVYCFSLFISFIFIKVLEYLITNDDVRKALIEPNIFPFQHIT